MPSHGYVTPPRSTWPIRKILENEGEKTYAPIHPLAQILSIIGFILGQALVLGFLLIVLIILVPIPQIIPGSQDAAGIALIAFVLLSLAILLSVAWISAFINISKMLITYRFSLQDEYIFVRKGTINPAYHMIPYENVQDAQVRQDVLLKMFNLASVSISTPASSVTVSPLPLETANKFKEDVLTLSRLHRGMAE